jgi:hypothetical protein
MPKLDFEREHFLRSKGGYIPVTNIGKKFKTSFFPHHFELWNNLPKNIQSSNLTDLKTFTTIELKPQKYKQKNLVYLKYLAQIKSLVNLLHFLHC